MPVQIDEISAEVAPAPGSSPPAESATANPMSSEIQLRRQREAMARLEVRAARLHAD